MTYSPQDYFNSVQVSLHNDIVVRVFLEQQADLVIMDRIPLDIRVCGVEEIDATFSVANYGVLGNLKVVGPLAARVLFG